MSRGIAVAVAVLLAAAGVFLLASNEDPAARAAAAVASVEKRLQAGDLAGARRERAELEGRIPPADADYLDALLLLAAGEDERAVEPLRRAHTAAPQRWRPLSLYFASLVNTGRHEEAWRALADFLEREPGDERALFTAATYWLELRPEGRDPERALRYLDRIEALPARRAPEGDPTAVRDGDLALLRAKATTEAGRTGPALVQARAHAESAPGDAEAQFVHGEAARRAGRLAESAAALRRAAGLMPGERRFEEQLVMVLLDLAEAAGPGSEEAAEALRRAESLAALHPQDPRLDVLAARALVRADRIDDAISRYRALLERREALPPDVRLTVLRNLAVALYDWKQGGQEGDYLAEAHRLLHEYVRSGGEVDARLRSTWETLQELQRK